MTASTGHQYDATAQARGSARLWDLAILFLRLGVTAFGGPAAHIAMMEDETVARRNWLSREQFLDLLGMANLLPGPSSSEMAIYLGVMRAGWPGLLLGGVCFVLPAALLTTLLAWAYLRFGSLPQTAGVLYGVRPVVVAIVLQALWRLGRTALKSRTLVWVGICAAALSAIGIGPVWTLLLCGALVILTQQARPNRARPNRARNLSSPPAGAGRLAAAGFWGLPASAGLPMVGAAAPVSLASLFLVFLKLGAVIFGSGYVLLAFLRADLVVRLHWLTEKQLLDAVAVGQVTPGPVFTAATFIGYLVAGFRGAALATFAIFLPAFALVAATGPLLPRLRKSSLFAAILDGITAGSLGLLAAVTLFLARAAILDFPTALTAIAGAILLLRFRISSAWLILGGAVLGIALGQPHAR